jgi:Glycosyltransferase family 87
MEPVVSPSREDGVVRAASEVAGGPAGSRIAAGGYGFWTAASVLLVAGAGMIGFAAVLRQHCRSTLWASPDQFTHACYSDVPVLFTDSGLGHGLVPYLEAWNGTYLAQPVGTGALLWLLGLVTPSGPNQARAVFDVAVLVVTVALLPLVLSVVRLSGRRPWDAALVALSPVLLTASLVSLDLVAVSLAVAGMLAFARRRPGSAGVLLGLGVAVRPMALLVLLALALVALRSGRWRHVGRTTLAAFLAWAAVNVPVMLLSFEGWRAYVDTLWRRPAGYGSIWLLPELAAAAPAGSSTRWSRLVHELFGHPLPPGAVRWAAVAGVLVVLVLATLFVLGPRARPRLPAVVLVLVVGVLVVSPSVPVQASLWVLPFAALAVPRWRDLLIWGGTEAVFDTVTWLYIYGQSEPTRGAPPGLYAVVLVARLAALGWLVWQAVALARHPRLDPVRVPADAPELGRDDPAAGEIEDAPDAVVVRMG